MTDTADEMMDALDRWAIRLLKAAAVLLAIALYLWGVVWWADRQFDPPPEPPPRRIVAQPSDAEKRWLNARFRYHGITSCVHENGDYYFYRDGKKCKL